VEERVAEATVDTGELQAEGAGQGHREGEAVHEMQEEVGMSGQDVVATEAGRAIHSRSGCGA